MKQKIILADDHLIFRSGLKLLLESNNEFEVIHEVSSGSGVCFAIEELRPDVVILDNSLSCLDDAKIISKIKQRYPCVKILALTTFKQEEYVRAALGSGVEGYLLKNDSPDELLLAVRAIVSGKIYISPSITRLVVNGYLDQAEKPAEQKLLKTSLRLLTRREQEVLVMVAEGKKNKEIAGFLSLSTKTIEKHRASMMAKLNFKNSLSLIYFAMENGLLSKGFTSNTLQ